MAKKSKKRIETPPNTPSKLSDSPSALGDFQFRLSDGPSESSAVQWLRNHSSYLTVGGIGDYLVPVAVLLRGLIVNFLVIVPWIIFAGLILGFSHHWILNHNLLLLKFAFAVVALFMLVHMIGAPLFRIWGYHRSLEVGSIDNARQRIWRERVLGWSLALIALMALAEVSPRIIEYFRSILDGTSSSTSAKVAASVGVTALLGSSHAILSKLSGHTRTIAIVLMGVSGLIIPWVAIMCVANYLVYAAPPTAWSLGIPTYAAVFGTAVIFLALLIGIIRGSFSGKETLEMVGLTLLVGLVSTASWFTWGRAAEEREKSLLQIGVLARPLAQLVKQPAFSEETQSRTAKLMRDIDQQRRSLNEFFDAQPVERETAKNNRWSRDYYQLGQAYVEGGERLANLTDTETYLLRTAISTRDRLQLLALAEKKRVESGSSPVTESELKDAIIREWVWKIVSSELSERNQPLNDDPSHRFFRSHLRQEFEELSLELNDVQIIEDLQEITILNPHVPEFKSLMASPRLAVYSEALSGAANVASKSEELLVPDGYSEEKLLAMMTRAVLRYQCQLHPFTSLRSEDFVLQLRDHLYPKPEAENAPASDIVINVVINVFNNAETPAKAGAETPAKANGNDLASEDEKSEASSSATADGGEVDDENQMLDAREFVHHQLIRKALSYFDVKQLAYLADPKDILHLSVPKHGSQLPSIAKDLDDKTAIWFAVRALEGMEAGGDENEHATAARNLLAEVYAEDDHSTLLPYIYDRLITIALYGWAPSSDMREPREPEEPEDLEKPRPLSAAELVSLEATKWARTVLGNLFYPSIPSELSMEKRVDLYRIQKGKSFRDKELIRIVTSKFVEPRSPNPDWLAARVTSGEFGFLNGVNQIDERLFSYALMPKLLLLISWIVVILVFCWLAADINFNSLHGYYRDRLARAFLIRTREGGEIEVEDDIALADLSNHHARSIAPYHIINVTLNLHGSGDIGLRDRRSDFFAITKRFVGSQRTGYCRSGTLRLVFPQVSLATSMAISAGAASPNMGRITNPFLVMFMSLLNIRMGYWIPNPGLLEETQNKTRWNERKQNRDPAATLGFSFDQVFQQELEEVQARWQEAYNDTTRKLDAKKHYPTVDHSLLGIGLSGGGIRSATLNLGILQVLDRSGVFRHADFLSTVSGGGYIGASISTQMRARTDVVSKNDGAVTIKTDADSKRQVVSIQGEETREYRFSEKAQLAVRNKENVGVGKPLIHSREAGVHADFEGTVQVLSDPDSEQQIVILSENVELEPRTFRYRFTEFDPLVVETGDTVTKGQPMVARNSSLSQRFLWAVPPRCLYREMLGLLHDKGSWVNLSDGGHIENLAGMELLRRRCKFIILGDGESDVTHSFNGLATLLRFARIDLGVEIDIDLARLKKDESGHTQSHWAIGKITYPKRDTDTDIETGYLLYLKSSMTGDEGELINEYRNNHPEFPHQATADQFFNEGQFEAYRALGQHIAEQVLADAGKPDQELAFRDVDDLVQTLWDKAAER